MIKLFLSLALIILILIFFWRFFFVQDTSVANHKTHPVETKKVKFNDTVQEIPPPTLEKTKEIVKQNIQEKIQENFVSKPPENNLEKVVQQYDQINPANFYTQDYNTPNFTTNVTDLRKFYSYDNPPNDSTPQVNLPTNPTIPPKNTNQPTNQLTQKALSDPSWLVPKPQPASGLELQSDYWSYNNEVPMNGGDFGGLTGFESAGDAYSLFYTKNTNDLVQEQEDALKLTDDLRNGLGTPQKQAFNYNMSNP